MWQSRSGASPSLPLRARGHKEASQQILFAFYHGKAFHLSQDLPEEDSCWKEGLCPCKITHMQAKRERCTLQAPCSQRGPPLPPALGTWNIFYEQGEGRKRRGNHCGSGKNSKSTRGRYGGFLLRALHRCTERGPHVHSPTTPCCGALGLPCSTSREDLLRCWRCCSTIAHVLGDRSAVRAGWCTAAGTGGGGRQGAGVAQSLCLISPAPRQFVCVAQRLRPQPVPSRR